MASIKNIRSKLLKLIRNNKRHVIVGGIAGLMIVGSSMYLYLNPKYDYPKARNWKTFRSNVTFEYPENWNVGSCGVIRPFIELPGTIKGNYKDSKNYGLIVRAYAECKEERAVLNYSETDYRNQTACDKGERLSNGLFIGLKYYNRDEIQGVLIYDGNCQNEVIGFFAHDINHTIASSDYDAYGTPTVNKEVFLGSPQYQDIKHFAESIRSSSN